MNFEGSDLPLEYEQVTLNISEQVATLTMNRPEKSNAWTNAMEFEVRDVLERCAVNPEVRVIVITGAGASFCVGNNLSEEAPIDFEPRRHSTPGDFDQRYSYLLGISKPIIAAINGGIADAGLILAMYCDFRLMEAGSRMSTAFARLGLIAGNGSAWMLPRLVGLPIAIDMLMTGRIISADEAATMGLVRLLPAEGFGEHVATFARNLARQSSPRSLAIMKRQIYAGLSSSLAEACILADREQLAALSSQDFREGAAAFREKRTPEFSGR